jgi:hypothetical protein
MDSVSGRQVQLHSFQLNPMISFVLSILFILSKNQQPSVTFERERIAASAKNEKRRSCDRRFRSPKRCPSQRKFFIRLSSRRKPSERFQTVRG